MTFSCRTYGHTPSDADWLAVSHLCCCRCCCCVVDEGGPVGSGSATALAQLATIDLRLTCLLAVRLAPRYFSLQPDRMPAPHSNDGVTQKTADYSKYFRVATTSQPPRRFCRSFKTLCGVLLERQLFLLAMCRSSGCTVAFGVVGVVGVCNCSQMGTSKCTCLIFGASIGLDRG